MHIQYIRNTHVIEICELFQNRNKIVYKTRFVSFPIFSLSMALYCWLNSIMFMIDKPKAEMIKGEAEKKSAERTQLLSIMSKR